MPLLTVSDLSKKRGEDFILSGISFTQEPLEKIAVAGETGSGKTSLLKMIAGLVQPDSGEIVFDSKKVTGPDDQLVPGHPAIAYLSQHYDLPKFLRIEQVLTYTNTLSGDEAQLIYEVCQITEFMKRRTDELSGGEKQRVALAKALIACPRLLLLDEPFSNLDIIHKNILKSVINDISESLEITCTLVSHDPLDTLSWANEILVMKEGKLIQKGIPRKIYDQPADDYVAGMFGKYNLLPVRFCNSLGIATDKEIIVRPENINLVPAEKDKTEGTITAIHFFGSYLEIEISILGSLITVRTGKISLSVGDLVNLEIEATVSPEA
jgi:ABC-type Fe3+/spermidine/putrescine transport system ATPase subunit